MTQLKDIKIQIYAKHCNLLSLHYICSLQGQSSPLLSVSNQCYISHWVSCAYLHITTEFCHFKGDVILYVSLSVFEDTLVALKTPRMDTQ